MFNSLMSFLLPRTLGVLSINRTLLRYAQISLRSFTPRWRVSVLHCAGGSAVHGGPSIIGRRASDDKLKTVANFCRSSLVVVAICTRSLSCRPTDREIEAHPRRQQHAQLLPRAPLSRADVSDSSRNCRQGTTTTKKKRRRRRRRDLPTFLPFLSISFPRLPLKLCHNDIISTRVIPYITRSSAIAGRPCDAKACQ